MPSFPWPLPTTASGQPACLYFSDLSKSLWPPPHPAQFCFYAVLALDWLQNSTVLGSSEPNPYSFWLSTCQLRLRAALCLEATRSSVTMLSLVFPVITTKSVLLLPTLFFSVRHGTEFWGYMLWFTVDHPWFRWGKIGLKAILGGKDSPHHLGTCVSGSQQEPIDHSLTLMWLLTKVSEGTVYIRSP